MHRLGDHILYCPQGLLASQVDSIWVADGYVAVTPRERILPTGALTIVINLGGERFHACEPAKEPSSYARIERPAAVVCGARARPLVIDTASILYTVGVHFKPGGAAPFVGSAGELEDALVPLDDVWGASGRTLRERLLEAPSNEARAKIMEETLLRTAKGRIAPRPALAAALAAFDAPDVLSVADVAQRIGLSAKRLIALFRHEVGLGPKSYWRIRRFRSALRLLETGRVSGASLAAEAGYFDQGHFIREFRALAGSCPRDYLAAQRPHSDHVALSD